ncbi:MAG: hypothetical protein NC116_12215 [Clostridium sp.]|nr:hypothetical protein [Clostridium sp.]
MSNKTTMNIPVGKLPSQVEGWENYLIEATLETINIPRFQAENVLAAHKELIKSLMDYNITRSQECLILGIRELPDDLLYASNLLQEIFKRGV